MAYSSPTMIARNIPLDHAALRGNLFNRATELGYDKYLGAVHRIKSVEKLGLVHAKRYMRICDAERIVIVQMAQGERMPRSVQISSIARLASTKADKVSRADVLEVLR